MGGLLEILHQRLETMLIIPYDGTIGKVLIIHRSTVVKVSELTTFTAAYAFVLVRQPKT